jgi:hypothetical protein
VGSRVSVFHEVDVPGPSVKSVGSAAGGFVVVGGRRLFFSMVGCLRVAFFRQVWFFLVTGYLL